MAQTPFKWMSGSGWTSLLTTALNSLADGARVISGEIDNSSNLYDTLDLDLTLASYTPTGTPIVNVYLLLAGNADGYPDGDASVAVSPKDYVDFFQVRTGATAKRQTIWGIPIPPGKFKLIIENRTNAAWAASGNTLHYRAYNRGVGTP